MTLGITFDAVILLERKSFCEYFSKRGQEKKSLCIAANVATGYVLHFHTQFINLREYKKRIAQLTDNNKQIHLYKRNKKMRKKKNSE